MQMIQANRQWLAAAVAGISLVGAAAVLAERDAERPPAAERGLQDARDLSSAFRHVTLEALPSVVSIEAVGRTVEVTEEEIRSPFDDESFPFRDLFRDDPRLREFFREAPRRRSLPPRRGLGSGFVIDSSGIILTNNHVVQDAEQVKVKLRDGRVFIATDIKTDPWSDVAIVHIDVPDELPALRLGDSNEMEIGDWVLAVGNPFGLEGSVTAGIISAKGRGPGITQREDFLQTDAAINPGNSGGPLLNLNGEVIGINTAISTRSGGYDGISFAIPISMAKWVAQQLIDNGAVRRAYLGVGIQAIDAALAERFNVAVGEGSVVTHVMPGSPAEDAGLEAGDVILEMNGRTVDSPRRLQGIVERLEVGQEYQMTVLRNGRRTTIPITVREMPADFEAAAPSRPDRPGRPRAPEDRFDDVGFEVRELSPELARRLGYEGQEGVLIGAVQNGSPAQSAGLQPGDLIQRVNDQRITSPDEFRQALEEASLEDGILFLVRGQAGTRFVVIQAR